MPARALRRPRFLGPAFCILVAACGREQGSGPVVVDGNAVRGRTLMIELECGVCHVIPGVRGSRGRVGPSLEAYSRRLYVAGKLPNSPDILAAWIRDPPAMAARTAMPAVPMSDADARDMAAYLYELD